MPVPPDETPELPGTHYRVLAELGQGGMGVVYRVLDPHLNRTMAMKVIRHEMLANRRAVARFMEEAQVTSQLHHPGIVAVHELGRLADDRLYFTMQEVEGRTLSDAIRAVHTVSQERWAHTPDGWSLSRLLEVYRRLCESVAYAHSRGVVHRDLKPTNVMLGQYGEVLVMDWGVSRVLEASDGGPTTHLEEPTELPRNTMEPRQHEPPPLPPGTNVVTARRGHHSLATRWGAIVGTPAFMAPEQASSEAATPAADIYSLGAILYQILCGRAPFSSGRPTEVLMALMQGPPPSVLTRAHETNRPPLPLDLVAICERAMARAPGERHPSALALAEDLRRWQINSRERDRAQGLVDEARALRPEILRLQETAEQLDRQAHELMLRLPPFAPVDEKRPAWRAREQAGQLARHAELAELNYIQQIGSALNHAPDMGDAHQALADYYQARHARAEEHDRPEAARYEQLLRSHDQGSYQRYLAGEGELSLTSQPPGASVRLSQLYEEDRRLLEEELPGVATTPVDASGLTQGRYLARVSVPGRPEIRLPLRIRRDACTRVEVRLPERLPEGFCWIPAGRYISGGDPLSAYPLPRREIELPDFAMQRFPITVAEWRVFMEALIADGKIEEARQRLPRGRMHRDRRWRIEEALLHIPEEPGWVPEAAMTRISLADAEAYAAWRSARDGLQLQLPTFSQWEKAARGVDGRYFPWGDHFDPVFCKTRYSRPGRSRPEPVGAFQTDSSPYGVRDMAGGVQDLLRRSAEDLPGYCMVAGGSWLGGAQRARCTARTPLPLDDISPAIGFRLVWEPLSARSGDDSLDTLDELDWLGV